jgi:hypothetical protein
MQEYNPLAKQSIAESVVRALLESPCHELPPTEPFDGAGIYVIYYSGPFKAYAPVAGANQRQSCTAPIYVGRAQHAGARKGLLDATPEGQPLFGRLGEHAGSIEAAQNLELNDFKCRYLVVDDLWVPLAERLLLPQYRPLWNVVIDGFGNHDPGGGRRVQKRSPWDVLHPGRAWAAKQGAGKYSQAEITEMVRLHFAEHG